MHRWLAPLLFVLPALSHPAIAEQPGVTVTTLPAPVLIQRAEFDQRLNFDILVDNATSEKLEIEAIECSAFARDGSLVSQRRLGSNGDSISTIPNRTVEAGARLVVFNPFHTYSPDLQLARLEYEIVFGSGEKHAVTRARLEVAPVVYETKTDLVLPVGGRVIAWDGPDLYGHHRRLDITGGMTTALGIKENFLRYAYDFSVVDEQGRMFKGTGERNEDWYGFGAPILSAGSGTVVAAEDGMADNTTTKRVELSREQVFEKPRMLFGNHVVVDHGNGEFSFYAHLKQGSVKVKRGQRVRQGEPIGQMGFSGDAITVHLHYQLQRDAMWGEGLPASFRNDVRLVGGRAIPAAHGFVDSGEVVTTAPAKRVAPARSRRGS
jgi:murein DD-endopeptidase MepM/ murein hydrolase activator NlpD